MNIDLFCKNCGRILKLESKESERIIGNCECGFRKEVSQAKFCSKGEIKKEIGIEEEIVTKGFSHICKKCGYGECEISEIGAPYSDESNIFLYICKKCGYTERDGYGTSNI